jgi:hypothetical protein
VLPPPSAPISRAGINGPALLAGRAPFLMLAASLTLSSD